MDITEERQVTGNMDSDSDLSKIPNPNIVETHNTRVSVGEENTQGVRTPIIGTALPFSIGDALAQQSKIIRVFPQATILDSTNHTISIVVVDRAALPVTGGPASGTFNGSTLASFKTFFDGLLTSLAYTYTSAVNATTGSVDYTLATEDLIITSSNPTYELSFYTAQELIPADQAGGNLIPLAIENIGDYVYIYSCNKDEFPSSGSAIAEYGRATFNENYQVWNYTRLIQSKEFNQTTQHQPDNIKIEQNIYRFSSYWTDNDNAPKAVYSDAINSKFSLDATLTILTALNTSVDLSKIYYVDGQAKINVCGEQRTISSVNNSTKTITVTAAFSQQWQNVYVDLQDISLEYRYNTGYGLNYDYIRDETNQFIVNQNIDIDYVEQSNGGRVTAGNKRYVARGVTADLVEYGWSRLSGMVNVYSAPPNELVVGDLDNIATGKRVKLTLSNINNNIFAYVDVAVINYNGGFPSGAVIKRVEVSGSQIDFIHIGTETEVPLDLNEIADTALYLESAKTNEITDNRCVLANVKIVQPTDFTDFFLAWEHTIVRNTLPQTPFVVSGSSIGTFSLQYGEQQNPYNVFNAGSGMINETYRIGVRVVETTGAVGYFWVDDIRIDNNAQNVTAGKIYNGSVLSNRRLGTVSDLDLSDADNNPYYYSIEFTPDWTVQVNGGLPTSYIKSIEIVRAPVIREVLTCGMAIPSSTYYTNIVPLPVGIRRPWQMFSNKVEAYLDRNRASCYFPDVLYGQTELVYTQGDQLLVYGRQDPRFNDITLNYRYQLYGGDMSTGGITGVMQTLDIDDAKLIRKFSQTILGNTTPILYQNLSGNDVAAPNSVAWTHEDCIAVAFETGQYMGPNGTVADVSPIYYVQYYRPVAYVSPDNSKYGTVSETVYESMGNSPIEISVATTTVDCVLNDVFTQCVHFKEQYPLQITGAYLDSVTGYGLTFFCQNIANVHMRAYDPDNINVRLFPNSFERFGLSIAVAAWLSYKWVNDALITQDQFSYDSSYSYYTGLQQGVATNVDLTSESLSSTAIYFSDPKPQNALSDPYRILKAANLHYLDTANGAITDLFKMRSELYAAQEYDTRRLYFNQTGTLESSPSLGITVGDGGVMNRDGYSITRFGSRHQQSVILGTSDTGDDVRYWFDSVNKKIVRFGGNGIDPISDTKMMNNAVRKHSKWAALFDYPAYTYGVHGAFDMANREMLMTFRGQKIVPDFNVGSYTEGDVVASTVAYTDNFYSLPKTLYRAKTTGVLGTPTGLSTDPNWEFVELSDTNYYSFITFVYSELTKGFSAYYDFAPKIFGHYQDKVLSSRPVDGTQDNIYVHNSGTAICRWWDLSGDYYESAATIKVPFNPAPIETKKWVYTVTDSSVVPHRMDFESVDDGKISYLTEAEFTDRRDNYVAPIKNDSTVTVDNPSGLNSLHTGGLRSKVLTLLYNFGTSQVSKVLRRISVRARILDKNSRA